MTDNIVFTIDVEADFENRKFIVSPRSFTTDYPSEFYNLILDSVSAVADCYSNLPEDTKVVVREYFRDVIDLKQKAIHP